VKNIGLVVCSGKGGVEEHSSRDLHDGAASGGNAPVGLLDADIYGPSVPTISA